MENSGGAPKMAARRTVRKVVAQAIKTRHGTAKEHPMTVNEGTIDRVLRV